MENDGDDDDDDGYNAQNQLKKWASVISMRRGKEEEK